MIIVSQFPRRYLIVACVLAVLSGSRVGAADASEDAAGGFLERTLEGRRYVVFVPEGEPPTAGWPLVLFLHGAGERGTDGRLPTTVGIGPAVRERAVTFPGVVVFPQADFAEGPILETWRADAAGGRFARDVLAKVEDEWPIDPARRSITGWSMGAYGALSLAASDPEHFTTVLAIAGGGEPDWGPDLARLPVWLVHGVNDRIVPAAESRAMVQAIPEPHEKLTLTEVQDAGHDVWRSVYDNDAVLEWLLSADVVAPPVTNITAPEPLDAAEDRHEAEAAFSPALVISRAVSLRLGNSALQTVAAGIPEVINEEGLAGELSPVEDEVEFDGRRFAVRFTRMSYAARLHRAVLRGNGPDRLRISLALKDFEVRIGEIRVEDRTERVTAGPVTVVIGHREPVWIVLEVRPSASLEGRLSLSLLRSEFAIPDHNWYVEPPETIQIRGDLFTKEVVTTAIVGGIYQRRETIERQILAAIDPMLKQVEKRADFSPLAQLVSVLWPLPVYRPRLKMQLEETSTDRNGVSLVFGCAAASVASAPVSQQVEHVSASVSPAAAIEQSTGMQAGVSVDVIRHLATMVADTDAATLYAADVPGRPFVELDDARAVAQLLDDSSLSRVDDVRARMDLREPFGYVPLPSEAGETSTVRMAIDIPRLSLTIFGKDRSSAPAGAWHQLVTRELMIWQPVELTAMPHLLGPTKLGAVWGEEAAIHDRSRGLGAESEDELVRRFRQGWARSSTSEQGTVQQVPDVAVGASVLRLDGLEWQGESLTALFRPAATVLLNETDHSVDYCVRSSSSRWSDRRTLGPNAGHVYRTGALLQIRDADRWSAQGEPLETGIYLWSTLPDDEGRHWHPRELQRGTAATE